MSRLTAIAVFCITAAMSLAFFMGSDSGKVVDPFKVQSAQVVPHDVLPKTTSVAPRAISDPANVKASVQRPTATLLPHERIRQLTNKSDFQQALLTDYDQHKRYPPNTTRLEQSDSNPITQRYAIDERTTTDPDDGSALTIWSDKKYYGLDDTVRVFAQLNSNDGQPINTNIQAQLIQSNNILAEFTLNKAAQGNRYQYNLVLNDVLPSSAKTGIYKILIKPSGLPIMDALTFTLSQPNIALTGNFKDHVNDEGHLVINMEVSVAASNRFYSQASLFNPAGTPIGVTQFSGELSMGNHWIELVFPGLLLHDAQEDGPYVLKEVSLAKVSMPLQRAPLDTPNYETQAYRLEAFSNTPYSKP